MKGFETYLQNCIRPEWSEHYLNYGLLKDHLRSFYSRRVQLRHAIGRDDSVAVDDFVELSGAEDVDDLMPSGFFQCVEAVKCYDGCGESLLGERLDVEKARYTLSTLERKEFSSLIEQHIKSVGEFYRNALLPHIQQRIDSQDYEEASEALLETMAFACTNIVTFRQLLIRYDAFCTTFKGMPLSAAYLHNTVMDVQDMFELERADELEKRITLGLQIQEEDGLEVGKRNTSSRGKNSLAEQVQKFHALLDITDEKVSKATTGESSFRLLVIELHRRTPIKWRGEHLKEQMRIIGNWNETKDFSHFSLPVEKGESFSDKLKDLEPQNIFPLVVNVLACFLFMMNNYIIAPSSAYYAEALGCNDALSGIMVGAAPLFAMSSSFLYSYWTNYNYKHPMIFAATLQIIGNLLYSCAFSFKSIQMCLIGRAITGLGAPRVINRRCLADVTPFSLRTTASVVFGLATALGAAFGPGISIVIDRIDEFQFKLPLLGEQFFNPMTGPGYLMCINWMIYSAMICFFFKEPKRTGLEELKRRETEPMNVDSKKQTLLGSVTSSSTSNKKICLYDGKSEHSFPADSSYCEDGGSLACDSLDLSPSHDEEIDIEPKEKETCCSCFRHMTRPVLICMTLVFFKRVALESIVGASPIVTKNRYGWTIDDVAALQVVNGLIIIPACLFAGYLSTKYEDRLMALCFLSVTLFGMVIMFDVTDLMNYHASMTYNEYFMFATGEFSYVAGSLIAFIGVEVCESFTASMMSKVVPSKMAKGTFNAGLLETLVGTGGRAIGDLFVTAMGLLSIRNLLNLLILPGMGLVASSIIMILWNYELLDV